MTTRKRGQHRTADVAEVGSGEPDGRPQRVPEYGERVRIRLHGHAQTYVVRAEPSSAGPRLTELTITADDGETVDYAGVQSVVRRLTYTAVQWIARAGGLIAHPDDTAETYARPEQGTDPRLIEVRDLVAEALALGLPVRKTVAARLPASLATVDRLIRSAKDEGLIDGDALPKAPPPRQSRSTTEGNDK